ncbi:hypothetical protein H5410_049921 [Solanum commersonii]|uniref:Uncharacterized protein n=1 Tax=Solanum commersonii TaxID=4109 RepID=A0A9J5WWG1_SOLCO|nr:hypothetical protein H5410_049921 [Solanum commersonii]
MVTLINNSILVGASARLVCYNEKNAIVQSAITDKNSEFRIAPKSLIKADIGKCKVYLVKSPNPTCNVPTNFNGGKIASKVNVEMEKSKQIRLLIFSPHFFLFIFFDIYGFKFVMYSIVFVS